MIISLVFNIVAFVGTLHPFHVSVCDMEHNEKSKSLEITHHIFLDDLEEALRKKYDPVLDIVNPSDESKRDEMLKEYILEHFTVFVNGKLQDGRYLGHEIENDAMYCYIEIEGVKRLKSISVSNNILMEIFDDQVNLVHIKVEGKIRSLKLDKREFSGMIDYEG